MIYLGCHWTTDAVAGFTLGSLIRIGVTPCSPPRCHPDYPLEGRMTRHSKLRDPPAHAAVVETVGRRVATSVALARSSSM